MCCIRINTDVILANIFAIRDVPISANELSDYVNFMYSYMPTYVITDFCKESVKEVVDIYHELYIFEEKDGSFVVSAGKMMPNLKFFNSRYSDAVALCIQRGTKFYFDPQRIKD